MINNWGYVWLSVEYIQFYIVGLIPHQYNFLGNGDCSRSEPGSEPEKLGDFEGVESYEACMPLCDNTEGCIGFGYDSDIPKCELYGEGLGSILYTNTYDADWTVCYVLGDCDAVHITGKVITFNDGNFLYNVTVGGEIYQELVTVPLHFVPVFHIGSHDSWKLTNKEHFSLGDGDWCSPPNSYRSATVFYSWGEGTKILGVMESPDCLYEFYIQIDNSKCRPNTNVGHIDDEVNVINCNTPSERCKESLTDDTTEPYCYRGVNCVELYIAGIVFIILGTTCGICVPIISSIVYDFNSILDFIPIYLLVLFYCFWFGNAWLMVFFVDCDMLWITWICLVFFIVLYIMTKNKNREENHFRVFFLICISATTIMVFLSAFQVLGNDGCHNNPLIDFFSRVDWWFLFFHVFGLIMAMVSDHFHMYLKFKKWRYEQLNGGKQKRLFKKKFQTYLKERTNALYYVFEQLSITGNVDFTIIDKIHHYAKGIEILESAITNFENVDIITKKIKGKPYKFYMTFDIKIVQPPIGIMFRHELQQNIKKKRTNLVVKYAEKKYNMMINDKCIKLNQIEYRTSNQTLLQWRTLTLPFTATFIREIKNEKWYKGINFGSDFCYVWKKFKREFQINKLEITKGHFSFDILEQYYDDLVEVDINFSSSSYHRLGSSYRPVFELGSFDILEQNSNISSSTSSSSTSSESSLHETGFIQHLLHHHRQTQSGVQLATKHR